MTKIYRILVAVLLCAGLSFFVYQAFVTKELAGWELGRALLVLLGLAAALIAPQTRKTLKNKKSLYQKAYAGFVRNAFANEPKKEKQFYDAVDDYNKDRSDSALKKLAALRKDCSSSDDLYAVTVFTALCYDAAGMKEAAAEQYESALCQHPNSTLASNLGACYDRLGDKEKALSAFARAIVLDSKNAFAYNNLAALYFRSADYEEALYYAEKALVCNDRLPQALSAAALSCALMGRQEEYESYYRRAVSCGYDGNRIKTVLRSLRDPHEL